MSAADAAAALQDPSGSTAEASGPGTGRGGPRKGLRGKRGAKSKKMVTASDDSGE
jgi:hypothetical protein